MYRRWRNFSIAAALLFPIAIAAQAPAPRPDRRVVITVDDLPGASPATDKSPGQLAELQRYNSAITKTLRAHHVPAIGFVNEARLQVNGERDARIALLKLWVDAGLDLGNHTFSHPNFHDTPLAQFEDETVRGAVVTPVLLAAVGKTERYFRHPYGSTGRDSQTKSQFEDFLTTRRYIIAPYTVENADYAFNDVLCAALDMHDETQAEQVRSQYLRYTETQFEFFENASVKVFGREIPQTFVVHDNEINSQLLDKLLTALESRGYRFISMQEALADPAYATPDRFVGPEGISWIDRWKVAFNQPPDFQHDPDPPDWIEKRFDEIRKAGPDNPQ